MEGKVVLHLQQEDGEGASTGDRTCRDPSLIASVAVLLSRISAGELASDVYGGRNAQRRWRNYILGVETLFRASMPQLGSDAGKVCQESPEPGLRADGAGDPSPGDNGAVQQAKGLVKWIANHYFCPDAHADWEAACETLQELVLASCGPVSPPYRWTEHDTAGFRVGPVRLRRGSRCDLSEAATVDCSTEPPTVRPVIVVEPDNGSKTCLAQRDGVLEEISMSRVFGSDLRDGALG